MNGLSYLLSTLGTQQPPLKVHHSRASGSDAVEMSPDFSRVTSDCNIYTLSTWYLQSIYIISTQQRTAECDCVPGPSVWWWWGPARARLTTDCVQTPGPDSGYLHTIYNIYNIYPGQEEERQQPSHCSTPLQQQLLNEIQLFLWNVATFPLSCCQHVLTIFPGTFTRVLSTSLLSLAWQVNKDNIMMMEHC